MNFLRGGGTARAWLAAVLCGACLAVCLTGRSSFYLGTALSLLRWPLVVGAALSLLSFLRGRQLFGSCAAGVVALAAVGEWVAVKVTRAEPARPSTADARELVVVTHNLLYQGAVKERSVAALKAAPADLLVLQEVTPEWVFALDRSLGSRYPHRALSPQKGTLGYAVYSRFPLRRVSYVGPNPRVAFGQCMDVELPDEDPPLYLCNVHLYSAAAALKKRSGVLGGLAENARVRRAQWEALRRHVEAHALGERRIVAGDFNTMEADPLHRLITAEYVDSFRHLRYAFGATWPHQTAAPLPLVRIDYVMVRGPMLPLSAEVIPESGSDHLAVRALVKVHGSRRRSASAGLPREPPRPPL